MNHQVNNGSETLKIILFNGYFISVKKLDFNHTVIFYYNHDACMYCRKLKLYQRENSRQWLDQYNDVFFLSLTYQSQCVGSSSRSEAAQRTDEGSS